MEIDRTMDDSTLLRALEEIRWHKRLRIGQLRTAAGISQGTWYEAMDPDRVKPLGLTFRTRALDYLARCKKEEEVPARKGNRAS